MNIKQQLELQAMYGRQAAAAPVEGPQAEKPVARGRKAKAEPAPVEGPQADANKEE